MSMRRSVVVGLLVAAVMVMGGCSSTPEITNEQVAQWEAIAGETIPAATEVTFDKNRNVDMFGSGSNSVNVALQFASYADLKASETAIVGLRTTIRDDARGTFVDVSSQVAESDAHEALIAERLVGDVPGLWKALVNESSYGLSSCAEPELTMGGNVVLYVDDESVLDPDWLDSVADAAQAGLSEVGGDLVGISIFPAEEFDRVAAAPQYKPVAIHIDQLQAFIDLGIKDYVVGTESWVYRLSGDTILTEQNGDSGGACP